jgi:glutamate-1-semialdehyde 2,1-aminomutase
MKNRPRSKQIFSDLCEVHPGGVNSPVRACSGMGQLPMVVASGSKDQIFDADGHAYIDYCGSWGALVHGHAHSSIVSAVQKRISMGSSFGIATEVEGLLGRKIMEAVPSIEKIRFVSSGTEATMSAARLARGFTGRDYIIKFNGNYHGHADFFLVQAGSGVIDLPQSSSAGIPAEIIKHTISLPYNDVEAFLKITSDPKLKHLIAAVIVEPIAGNMGLVPSTAEFLQVLRTETQRIGALLILDEVISGFRVALGGAQSIYKVKPDLTCLGKIIGGGFPAAAFGGRKEIMNFLAPLGPVYQAGTLSGNPVAMEAGLETLKLLEQKGFYKTLEDKTNLITIPVREAIKNKKLKACLHQSGSMFTLFFGLESIKNMEEAKNLNVDLYASFFRFMFEHGIYLPPSQYEVCFVSSVHSAEHLEKTRDLILQFLEQAC